MSAHQGSQHLDLETRIEFSDVVDHHPLPVDRFNIALKASLERSGKQEVDGVRLGCLGLCVKVGVVPQVVVGCRMADTRRSTGHHFGPAHCVSSEPSGAPCD